MPKEQMHICSFSGEDYRKNKNYLSVFSCGAQHITVMPYHVIREKGRIDYHILYIEAGTARVYYEGKQYHLSKGQFVLYPPGQKQEYILEINSVSYWLHFHGTHTAKILEDCGLCGGVFTAKDPWEVGSLFPKLVHAMHPIAHASDSKKNALMLSVLCALAEKSTITNTLDPVWAAVHHLQTNFSQCTATETLAAFCNLSRSRFLSVFKEHIGTTPHQYLLNLRVERAKELLTEGSLSVSEIASIVGFDDPFYFSRIFKKIAGMTPRDFQKRSQKA